MQLLFNPLDKPLLQALRIATLWFYCGFIFDILRQTEVGAASSWSISTLIGSIEVDRPVFFFFLLKFIYFFILNYFFKIFLEYFDIDIKNKF
jgi:hypothetical protein